MNDSPFVAVDKCSEHLFQVLGCLVFIEAPRVDDLVKELTARAEFGDDVEVTRVLIKFVDLQDVRMVKLREYLNLVHHVF